MSARITWLGHATFRLSLSDERIILIDPWLAENPACPDDLKRPARCDFIFLTHGHFDHVGDVASLIDAFDPMVVGNLELCAALEKQLGKGRYSGMNTGGTQVIDGVRVSLTPALHSSGYATPDGIVYAGMPNGLVVSADGLAPLYHAGDTDVFTDMRLIRKLFQPKIAILPIGDHFTMGAAGAALAAEFLDPSQIIPCHYKTFPMLDQSTDAFRGALCAELLPRLIVQQVGESLTWTADGAN